MILDNIIEKQIDAPIEDLADATVRIAKSLRVIVDANNLLHRTVEEEAAIITRELASPAPPFMNTGFEMTVNERTEIGVICRATIDNGVHTVRSAVFYQEPDALPRGPALYIQHTLDKDKFKLSGIDTHRPQIQILPDEVMGVLFAQTSPILLLAWSLFNQPGIRIDVTDHCEIDEDVREKWRSKRGPAMSIRHSINLDSFKERTATQGGIGMDIGQASRLIQGDFRHEGASKLGESSDWLEPKLKIVTE